MSVVARGEQIHVQTGTGPLWWRPGVAMIGLGLIALILDGATQVEGWQVPGVLLVSGCLVLLPAIWRALRREAAVVLADHLLVLTCVFIVYFVFGALLIPLGPRDQAAYSLAYYSVDASLTMRVTAINYVGLGLALVSGSAVRRDWVSRLARSAIRLGRSIPPKRVLAAFLLIGGGSWLHILGFDTNLRTGVAPGFVRTLSQLLLVAIVIAAAHRGRNHAWMLALAIVLAVAQAIGGVLLLNKSSALLPLMALLVGLMWRLGVRRVVIPGVLGVLAILVLVAGPVSTGRMLSPPTEQFSWAGRMSALLDARSFTSDYAHWSRFNYINSQGAAVELYDTGNGGDEVRLMGWVFVPRLLFPDKPVITAVGSELHYKISGGESSSTGQGVFVNGYYNLGWWGVLAVSVAVGCMLAWTSAFAFQVYRAAAMIWLPMALLGSFMAFRIDGAFVADYLGPFVLLSYLAIGGASIRTLLAGSRRW